MKTRAMGRVTITALKKSTWLWHLKSIFAILLFILKDFKASEIHANYLKFLHGKFKSLPAAVRCVRSKKASPCDMSHDTMGEGPQRFILYWMASQRAVQQSQTRHCYLGGKGRWDCHWSENTPALAFPDTRRGQAYGTGEP